MKQTNNKKEPEAEPLPKKPSTLPPRKPDFSGKFNQFNLNQSNIRKIEYHGSRHRG